MSNGNLIKSVGYSEYAKRGYNMFKYLFIFTSLHIESKLAD